jgi:hypothetical protein
MDTPEVQMIALLAPESDKKDLMLHSEAERMQVDLHYFV